MPVIVFANTKGGSGKTTSALLLACQLAQNTTVTLIDADPRHPIGRWESLAPIPKNLSVLINRSERTILDLIEEAATQSAFVLVDLEGTASRLMSYAISQADLVIIPIKEQQQDALAALDVIGEIKRDMKAARRTIPYSILITQSKAAVKSRTAKHIAAQFHSHPDIDTFKGELHERDAFAAIFAIGGAIQELDPSDVPGKSKAIDNVSVVTDELIAKLRNYRERETNVA